jgi:serine O-acetyltransferase
VEAGLLSDVNTPGEADDDFCAGIDPRNPGRVLVFLLSLMDKIKEELLESYRLHGGINHMDGPNLPSREGVDAVANDLMHLLFPGYFEKGILTKQEFDELLVERLTHFHRHLAAEIGKCLQFRTEAPLQPATAEEEARHIMAALPAIRGVLRTDVEAAFVGDPAAPNFEEIILAYPCVLAISLYRVAHVAYLRQIPLLPRMLTEYAHRRTGIDIHPGAEIGSHFFIDHGTGVVIGETTTIGKHVKLYQGVTLGAKSFKLDESGKIIKGIKRHPDIEDHVTIYSGATILGGETRIGANSIVGANVWLMESMPPNSIAYYKGINLTIRSRDKDDKVEERGSRKA